MTDEQRRVRVEWCEFMLRKFNGGCSKLTWEVLTCEETWIDRYDLETKIQSAVWLFPDKSPSPKTQKITQRTEETVSADWYVHHCLPKVFEVWYQRRPKTGLRGLFLRHDNASAHTAATTVDFLNENEVQLLPHPSCSQGLSPCVSFPCPEVKNN